ncbi:MAG: M18 family aminopeptidase [Pseudomonadales bacterium]
MNSNTAFNAGLCDFIARSPTPFHAVVQMQEKLQAAGFIQLQEQEKWHLDAGGKYFVIRNGSSIIALVVGDTDVVESGMHIVGAHTDSPCLKVKPNADMHRHGYHQLGLEVYGGVLLNPWFDRDLSIAGRVSCQSEDGSLHHCLLDFERAVALIPSLAIHLDREANDKRSINKQTDLPAILSLTGNADNVNSFRELLCQTIREQNLIPNCKQVLDYELSLYDTQVPAVIGLNNEFIASARLDNLLSCFAGLQALLDADGSQTSVLVCNDHEEVGSSSAAGANGPMLRDSLVRLCGSEENLVRCMQNSMLVSADNAHGVHPNFSDKHDNNHGPILNQGVVIKINANQRYATNSETAARFRLYAESVGAPVQSFVVRSDMGCGSTIGPITASELGIATVDVGVPTFAMHSIREWAGSDDAEQLANILGAFYRRS